MHIFPRVSLAVAAASALFVTTSAFAQTRSLSTSSASVRSVSSVSTTMLRTTAQSSSSTTSKTVMDISGSVSNTTGIKVSELPYCGSSKDDQMLFWDGKAKKWGCKSLSAIMPPKCDTKDSVLRFDGTSWKCEVIPGILVAHTATMDDFNGKNTCDTTNTWGGATCEITSSGMGAKLKCPANTLQVNTNALNGYQVGGTYPLFGGEYHAFCYSKPINVLK
jgi:hypothetical protein